MKDRAVALAVGALLLLWTGTATAAEQPPTPLGAVAELSSRDLPAVVPGEVIVRYEVGAGDLRAAARRAVGARGARRLALPRTQVLELPRGTGARAAARELGDLPGVAWAEPNYVLRIAETLPDDPTFGWQWGLHNTGQSFHPSIPPGAGDADIDAPEAWDYTTGAEDVVVAVVDSGVEMGHPEFAGNEWRNPDEVAGDGLDNDDNGLVDDVAGWDFVTGDEVPDDPNGHGTHVAGTIAAAANGQGVVGVAWRAQIMPLRVADPWGRADSAAIADAFAYAGSKGADVVNASLAGAASEALDSTVVGVTVKAHPDTLYVVAAGNGGDDGIGDDNDAQAQLPCNVSHANLICVAATDHNDELTSFSNFGAVSVDLAAPGRAIWSTYPRETLLGEERFTRDVFTTEPLWDAWTAVGAPANTWGRLEVEPGEFALADSPDGDYLPGANSAALAPLVNVAGKHGCRLWFDYAVDMDADPVDEPADIGETADAALVSVDPLAAYFLDGLTDGSASLPLGPHQGSLGVGFGLWADDEPDVDDGAWFDNVRLDCRADLIATSSGTSMASPHVAGVAALLRSWLPDASVAELRGALLGGVDRLAGLAGKVATGGRLNAYGALRALDGAALTTQIAKAPRKRIKTRKRKVKVGFRFRPRVAEAGLECKLERRKWRPCARRASFKVGKGKHTVRVRATRGLAPGPVAKHTFVVKQKARKGKRKRR